LGNKRKSGNTLDYLKQIVYNNIAGTENMEVTQERGKNMKNLDLSLYLVTDSTDKDEAEFLEIIDQACNGGVTLVQLREKEKTGLDYMKLAEKVKRVTDKYDVPLIIDDRVDIAMAVDAAGVHVGQSDIPVYAARKLMGDSKIIGATTKTVEQAQIAKNEGADYLGVGAIYPTTLKVITVITEVSTLNDIAAQTNMPIVAIGGLNTSNIQILYDSMADGIAVVSAIMKNSDPRGTAVALKKQVLENFKKLK
jgi:thiamine-phosphate pyrophosphorylase